MESARFRSIFTVLEQRSEGRVVLAEVDIASKGGAGSQAGDYKPAARFTLSLPPEGAIPGEVIQTAGLAGAPFPGWKFESLFPPVPSDGKTTASVMLDIAGGMVDVGQQVTTEKNVTNLVTELSGDSSKELKQYSTSARFSNEEASMLDTSQTIVAQIQPAPGTRAMVTLSFETKRVETRKVSEDDRAQLGKDVAAAIPLTARIRSIAVSGEDASKQTLKELEDYIAIFPNGVFSPIFQTIRDQVTQMRALRENSTKVAEGSAAPDFEGTDLDGKTIKLSALRGKVVLLDFWATWCGPCVGLIPEMKRIFEANQNKPFVLLGISADHEEAALRDFVKKRELKWPQVYEGDPTSGTAMLAYGVTKYPTTVLIDAQGQIRKVDAHGDELTQAIDELIGEAK